MPSFYHFSILNSIYTYASKVNVRRVRWTQTEQSLACDLSGHPSCYGSGYSAGLINKEVSCSSTLLNLAGTPVQVVSYYSGFMAAQQQQLQQQKLARQNMSSLIAGN